MIHVGREAGVALVTIDRQDALNALDMATLTELRDNLRELAADETARVVILTGAGEKAFVAGADIKYMSGLDVEGAKLRKPDATPTGSAAEEPEEVGAR